MDLDTNGLPPVKQVGFIGFGMRTLSLTTELDWQRDPCYSALVITTQQVVPSCQKNNIREMLPKRLIDPETITFSTLALWYTEEKDCQFQYRQ